MMKTLKGRLSAVVVALALSLGVAACEPLTVGLTAAEVGVRLAKAVKEARAAHPEDFAARADIYAGLYCELRDDYDLEWAEIRAKAVEVGAPVWAVDQVRGLIDRRCGVEVEDDGG